jgi:hypothetical protein
MRLLPLLAVLAFAATPAAAETIVSQYTDIDTDRDCTVFSKNEEGGDFANIVCNGYKGYPVMIFYGDLRESLFYGYPPEGDLPRAWESFGAFNSTGPKIEWRIARDGDVEIPFATIHRWFVSSVDDPEKNIEVLAIAKVGQVSGREGCTVGLVVASGNTKANETARKVADQHARDFTCGVDQRIEIAGKVPLPDFYRQER